jgi:hypothetical protein
MTGDYAYLSGDNYAVKKHSTELPMTDSAGIELWCVKKGCLPSFIVKTNSGERTNVNGKSYRLATTATPTSDPQ